MHHRRRDPDALRGGIPDVVDFAHRAVNPEIPLLPVFYRV